MGHSVGRMTEFDQIWSIIKITNGIKKNRGIQS